MRTTGGITALDLGTTSGWAVAFPGEEPIYGSWRMPSDRGDGYFFSRFRDHLADHITVHAPRLIVYEAPLITGAHTHIQTVMRLFGLAAHVVQIADLREIRVDRANNSTVKKFATGNGRAQKIDIIDAMRRRGWQPQNDNVADALAVLVWAEAKHSKVRRSAGPLFASAL